MDELPFLQNAVSELGLPLSSRQLEILLAYVRLIQTWNKAYNLVGTSDSFELIQKHILDSLAVSPFITQGPVLDVGSGAGLPGIPLAIALPDISFTLLDANGKKARFMRQAVMQLQLGNVHIVQSRVEQYQATPAAKIVLARAFAPLDKALQLLQQVCAQQAMIQIMLGVKPTSLPNNQYVNRLHIEPISVPGLDSQRHILIAHIDKP